MMLLPDWVGSDVSRETIEDLQAFVALVEKWNPKINLVSKNDLNTLWERHIWDSLQIVNLVDMSKNWMDLGSGGGFPGILVAICAKHTTPDMKVTLVESDQRKSAFLRTAIREMSLNAVVKSERVESLPSEQAEVLSARALADLSDLLSFAELHLAEGGTCVFPKGACWKKEIENAQLKWSFSYTSHKSKTNADASILTIRDIQRV